MSNGTIYQKFSKALLSRLSIDPDLSLSHFGNEATYKDVFNGIFRPLDFVIQKTNNKGNAEAMGRLNRVKPLIFNNGQLSGDTLNRKYTYKRIPNEELRGIFKKAELNGIVELKTLLSYCNVELYSDIKEVGRVQSEARPHLKKIIDVINPPK